MLEYANTPREPMSDRGLQCIRRTSGQTTTYFIANRGSESVDGWILLGKPFTSAVFYNPMTGSFGKAMTKHSGSAGEVYLQLVPGESCLVQLFPNQVNIPEYPRLQASGDKIPLTSPWELTFMKCGPLLPEVTKMKEPVLWSGLEGDPYKAFSGTAVYKTTFAKPAVKANFYRLSLGQVFHSARVSLNGEYKGTLISPPFIMDIQASEIKEENLLEISVSNLMGNRVAVMERKGEPFKIFYNVNFPARDAGNRGKDGLFTTSGWLPQESGMKGPVTLQPMKK
jgi:hypothetical protein